MEAVVDRAVTVSLLMPRSQAVEHPLPGALNREIDDGRRAAPRCSASAGLKGVRCLRAAERHLHVGMGVDTARHDVLVARVDEIGRASCRERV